MYGEGVAGHMPLDELLALERQLETWMYYTRSAKVRRHIIPPYHFYYKRKTHVQSKLIFLQTDADYFSGDSTAEKQGKLHTMQSASKV